MVVCDMIVGQSEEIHYINIANNRINWQTNIYE